MVLGQTVGRCDNNTMCEDKYGNNSQCLNMNKDGIGHCTFSPMFAVKAFGGKKGTRRKRSTKKGRQNRKKGTRRKRSTKN